MPGQDQFSQIRLSANLLISNQKLMRLARRCGWFIRLVLNIYCLYRLAAMRKGIHTERLWKDWFSQEAKIRLSRYSKAVSLS
jgi:hypothetical protein